MGNWLEQRRKMRRVRKTITMCMGLLCIPLAVVSYYVGLKWFMIHGLGLTQSAELNAAAFPLTLITFASVLGVGYVMLVENGE